MLSSVACIRWTLHCHSDRGQGTQRTMLQLSLVSRAKDRHLGIVKVPKEPTKHELHFHKHPFHYDSFGQSHVSHPVISPKLFYSHGLLFLAAGCKPTSFSWEYPDTYFDLQARLSLSHLLYSDV